MEAMITQQTIIRNNSSEHIFESVQPVLSTAKKPSGVLADTYTHKQSHTLSLHAHAFACPNTLHTHTHTHTITQIQIQTQTQTIKVQRQREMK